MSRYDRDEIDIPIPADLEKDAVVAAASAASTSANSYTKTIRMVPVKDKTYKFFFTYLHEDSETKLITESERSPAFLVKHVIENGTLPVQDLTLTPGFKCYGVKFTINPLSTQDDVVIFESLTSDFAVQNIVYVGTSTNVTIQASSYAPRWVKVRSRDRWDDFNISEVTAGPVTPLNSEIDTTKVPKAPTGVGVTPSIDPEDKSGFSIKIDVSWTASTDADTNGYVIRWSANNPATVTNPLWEYGQVDGKEATKFSITGLTPNTVYYWQVTAKSPFNSISWNTGIAGQVASGSFGPVSDPNAPAGNLQLRSILSIGGKTADLFKIGTGITQSINTSNTITPTQTAGTYNGIILDRSTTNFGHNYWLNTGQFRVGSESSFLYWDGLDVYTTGKINATGGTFTGNLRVTTGSIIAGGTFAADGSVSGARVVMQTGGLYAHDATGAQSVVIQSADGLIDARKGFIGGWTINGTEQTTGTISSSNTKIESNGTITLGDTTGTLPSIVRLSATDPFRIWVGSQSSSNAAFKVSSAGVLTATGAVITGNVQVTSGSTYDSIVAAQAAAASANTTAGTANTNASAALTTANGKNSIFRSASTPSALKAGDIWINFNDENKLYVAEAAGTGNWVLSRDTTIAAAVTKADDALAKATAAVSTANAAYPANNFSKSAILQAINASTNGATLNGGVLEAGTVVADNVVSTYVYAGYINADKINAGMITGVDIDISTDTSTGRFKTSYNRTGSVDPAVITSTAINAVAFVSVSTSGWVSSCYPYWNGGSDLGTTNFKWRRLLVDNGNYGVASDSYVDVGSGLTRLYSDGRIYANTLGVGTGTTIVQSSGYLRVSSSSRRYKENIQPITGEYLSLINMLQPITFSYKPEFSKVEVNPPTPGLIAEDVHDIEGLRGVVNYNENEEPESISYERLSVFLAMAIKELSNKVDSLSTRLDALEA